jgi:hypothetical protein
MYYQFVLYMHFSCYRTQKKWSVIGFTFVDVIDILNVTTPLLDLDWALSESNALGLECACPFIWIIT